MFVWQSLTRLLVSIAGQKDIEMKRHEILGNHIEGDLAAIMLRREANFEKRVSRVGQSQQFTR